jgi:endogenous inhibitor of DNA gyrase (YacG/DUF329 family)
MPNRRNRRNVDTVGAVLNMVNSARDSEIDRLKDKCNELIRQNRELVHKHILIIGELEETKEHLCVVSQNYAVKVEGQRRINKLLEKSLSRNKETTPCAICTENVVKTDKIYEMACGHKFHTHCIVVLLNSSNKCPVCKYDIVKEDEGPLFINVHEE